jgi:hypothetical protein
MKGLSAHDVWWLRNYLTTLRLRKQLLEAGAMQDVKGDDRRKLARETVKQIKEVRAKIDGLETALKAQP